MLATRLCAALALLAQIQATTSMHPPSQREAQMVLRCWIPSWVSDKHATCGHIACRCATGSTLAPIASVGVLRLRGAGGDSTESDDYAGDEVIVDGMGTVERSWRREELARVEAFKRAPRNPMAVPLATDKFTKRVFRYLKRHAKAAERARAAASAAPAAEEYDKTLFLGRVARGQGKGGGTLGFICGVKRVTATLKKAAALFPGGGAVLVLAADTLPWDLIAHLPITCEEAHVPYVFVPSQYFLGEAAQVKKSCVAAVLAIRPPPLDAAAHSARAVHRRARLQAHFDRLRAGLVAYADAAALADTPARGGPSAAALWDAWSRGGLKGLAPSAQR